jgi:hypothetical protein
MRWLLLLFVIVALAAVVGSDGGTSKGQGDHDKWD